MSSEQQITANRENAKKSTGPITSAGKEAVSGNAVRHGLMSTKPVIPHLESPEAWEEHYSATVSTLEPQGHIEGLLVERIAVLTWRLGRVVRYETESIAVLQERAEDDLKESRYFTGSSSANEAELKRRVQSAEGWRDMLVRFQTATDEEPIPSYDASEILAAICEEVGLDPQNTDECEVPQFPGLGALAWGEQQWTAEAVRSYATALVEKGEARRLKASKDNSSTDTGRSFAAVWLKILRHAQKYHEEARTRLEQHERQLDHWRRRKMLPSPEILSKIARYEAHLERSLFRTMQELRQLQRQRGARPMPVRQAKQRVPAKPDSRFTHEDDAG